MSDEDYYDLVYEGRHLCGAEPVKGQYDAGYCGIPAREDHDSQIEDAESWVHSSIERWFERAFEHSHGKNAQKHHKRKKTNTPPPSDRRLAVAATKRRNENASE